ncbi:MAG TPA: HAD family phosphatase [Verrucomicrobiae bacterium]|nr:HAD family phosphatase [Verrucomicrobiae bacterium]
MKPTVVFDLGKVLVDFDYAIAARKIVARSTHPPDNLNFLWESPLLLQLESGQLNRREFFEAIQKAIGFQGDLEEFSLYFGDIFEPIAPMVDLHSTLRQQKIPTYILSNVSDIAINHIRKHFPFFNHFDGYVFSYEAGSLKPEAKIYEALERLTGKRGADLIYIDDRPENIEAAKARGWRAILHESPEKSRTAVLKFLGDA